MGYMTALITPAGKGRKSRAGASNKDRRPKAAQGEDAIRAARAGDGRAVCAHGRRAALGGPQGHQ